MMRTMTHTVRICLACSHVKELHKPRTGCIVPSGYEQLGQGATREIPPFCGCTSKGRGTWKEVTFYHNII